MLVPLTLVIRCNATVDMLNLKGSSGNRVQFCHLNSKLALKLERSKVEAQFRDEDSPACPDMAVLWSCLTVICLTTNIHGENRTNAKIRR